MREKLLDLMKNEGLKPSQLAEMLEINPAGISHILAGRNKPGFDLLQKILRRFPRINPDWLMLDSNKMYRDDDGLHAVPSAATTTPAPVSESLFGQTSVLPENPPQSSAARLDAPDVEHNLHTVAAKHGISVERVVIFYNDHTFESYAPSVLEK